jgi:hypothetical protein
MTPIRARTAAPPTPATTPITIFLLLSLRPPVVVELWRTGTMVAMRDVEAKVVASVVTTPSMVVTKSVVMVVTDLEKEVV